ncbi:hypothetical protein ACER0C_001451 [Sarotherodon galilaeus]
MKILQFVFLCFSSDPAVLVKAKHNIWSAAEGANGTLNCNLTLSGSTKFFCKEKCQRSEDIIKTDGSTAQTGRYSIKYEDGASGRGIPGLHVFLTFTHMIYSDSGMYRCGLGKSSAPDSHHDFEVRVSNDLDKNIGLDHTETKGEKITLVCSINVYGHRKFFCKNECKIEGEILIDTANNKSLTKSDTGLYICGYGNPLSPDSYESEYVLVSDATTQSESVTAGVSTHCPDSSWLLVVRASLDGVLLMLFYISKTRRNFGLNTRENDTNMELSVGYENFDPTSKHDESKSSRTKPTLHY